MRTAPDVYGAALAAARLRKRSFSSTCRTWVLTVASLITSRLAISRLRSLSARRASTSRSRSVRLPNGPLRRTAAQASMLGAHHHDGVLPPSEDGLERFKPG